MGLFSRKKKIETLGPSKTEFYRESAKGKESMRFARIREGKIRKREERRGIRQARRERPFSEKLGEFARSSARGTKKAINRASRVKVGLKPISGYGSISPKRKRKKRTSKRRSESYPEEEIPLATQMLGRF